jgi:hypothetical protein
MHTDYVILTIMALPFVAIFFYFYTGHRPNMWPWRRPATSPQAPERRKRPGRLARWRARRGVRHAFATWTIGYSNCLFSRSVKLDDLRHHALICGATGSGKTSALQLLVDAFADKLPIIFIDCKASVTIQDHIVAIPNSIIWRIGGTTRWNPLCGDSTSVANRLIQGEWYSREADVYRASAERYLLWLLQALDVANLERTPQHVMEYLEPTRLLALLRSLTNNDLAFRLASQIGVLGQFEREGIAGFRSRFGLLVESIAGRSLGPGLALETLSAPDERSCSVSTQQSTPSSRPRSAPGSCSTASASRLNAQVLAWSSSTSSPHSDAKVAT